MTNQEIGTMLRPYVLAAMVIRCGVDVWLGHFSGAMFLLGATQFWWSATRDDSSRTL